VNVKRASVMPYKRKEDKAKQMRRYRNKKKNLKQTAKKLAVKKKKELKKNFPDIYKYIFG